MNPALWVTPLVAAALAAAGYLIKRFIDGRNRIKTQIRQDSIGLSDALAMLLKLITNIPPGMGDSRDVLDYAIRARQAAERVGDRGIRSTTIELVHQIEGQYSTGTTEPDLRPEIRELMNRLYEGR